MLEKPNSEIETEVLAAYDANYVGFCQEVFEGMEKSNPGMADLFYLMMTALGKERSFILGLQMASAVYRQLERATDGHLPIVEMQEALRATAFEALRDPEAFVNKYGTAYFYNGLIGKRTLVNFLSDCVGHGVEPHLVTFVPVFVIRILEVQIELDLTKTAH